MYLYGYKCKHHEAFVINTFLTYTVHVKSAYVAWCPHMQITMMQVHSEYNCVYQLWLHHEAFVINTFLTYTVHVKSITM